VQEYDDKYAEVEQIVQPIFTKLYGSGGGPGGDAGEGSDEMPNHEEL
jgi:hypothetical protein